MLQTNARLIAPAALNGLIAVAAGAFAAHGVDDPAAREWLRTGAQYQLIHAVAAVAVAERAPLASSLFSLGGLVFGASLYALAFGAPRWLGAVAPLGGLALLAGWAALAIAALRPGKPLT